MFVHVDGLEIMVLDPYCPWYGLTIFYFIEVRYFYEIISAACVAG